MLHLIRCRTGLTAFVGCEVHLVLNGLMPPAVFVVLRRGSRYVGVVLRIALGVVPLNTVIDTDALVKMLLILAQVRLVFIVTTCHACFFVTSICLHSHLFLIVT